ncbi:MAG: response regulator, partial [Smithellaceae bacterium]|nr:response regulator [Smithellaceae bacterium]
MTTKAIRILLIEDSLADAEFVRELLREEGGIFLVEHKERLGEALQALERERFDAILTDLGLPDSRGLETFCRLKAHSGSHPIVVLTGLDDEALAVEALRKGAQDYLVKGSMDAGIIQRSLLYAIERQRLQAGPENGVLAGLLVEDSDADAEYIEETLKDAAFFRMNWRRAGSLAGALAAIAESTPEVVLLDLVLPDSSGLETFTRLHAAHPDLPVIVLTVLGDEALAVRTVREGAQDFLTKGRFDPAFLARRIRFAVERSRSERERILRRRDAILQEQLDFLQVMMEAMPCAVFYKDTAGRYLGCNRNFAGYLGMRREKIIG